MKVWCLYYTIKIGDEWLKGWNGPCGIYATSFRTINNYDCLRGRPFFFRTRKLAREEAKKMKKENAKYRVVPFELKWKRA